MGDNTIYMKEKDEYPKNKKEHGNLIIRVYINGKSETVKSASLKYSKPLVEKIEGPFNDKNELIDKVKIGETYIFKVTKHKESILSLKKNIWWAEQIEDGEICDLKLNDENLYLDNEKNVCFKHKVSSEKPTRIYAYVSKPIKKVSILINEVVKTETLLIVGTEQHSANYGNKLMFPAQAIREIKEKKTDNIQNTILIFTDGYNSAQLKTVQTTASTLDKDVNFVKIDSVKELINYINNGKPSNPHDNKKEIVDRKNIKIGSLKVFSHGLPSILDFGLDGDDRQKQQFEIKHVSRLNMSAFSKNAEIYSYACRTGNSDGRIIASASAYTYDDDWYNIVKPQESLAQKLADHLELTIYAYIRRSLYVSTWNDQGDEEFRNKNTTIEDESVNGQWYDPRDWDKWDETLWNPNGAYGEPTHGNTPKGLPGGLYKFEKGTKPTKN